MSSRDSPYSVLQEQHFLLLRPDRKRLSSFFVPVKQFLVPGCGRGHVRKTQYSHHQLGGASKLINHPESAYFSQTELQAFGPGFPAVFRSRHRLGHAYSFSPKLGHRTVDAAGESGRKTMVQRHIISSTSVHHLPFVKGQALNYGFCGHTVGIQPTQLCHCREEVARWYVNGQSQLSFSKI